MEKIVILPKIPISVNTAIMTDEEIHEKLQRGYTDAEAGNVRSAAGYLQNLGRTIRWNIMQ